MPRASKPAAAPAKKVAKPKTAAKAPAKSKPAAKVTQASSPARTRKGKAPLSEKLTPKAERFVHEYLIDLNGTQAYLRSHPGVKATSASVEAVRLLGNPKVQEAIAAGRAKTADKLEITRESLLAEIWGVVKADPRELVEYIVLCCRHCHGAGHAYQWRDEDEFEAAHESALVEFEKKRRRQKAGEPEPKLRLPTDAGGYGFDARRPPNRDCPDCLGQGLGRTVLKDTRTLSPQALSLYAGVKETEKGVEVKMHSKLDAAEKIAKHLGLYEKDNAQKGMGIADMLAEFASGLHARQVGRLPITRAPAAAAPRKPWKTGE